MFKLPLETPLIKSAPKCRYTRRDTSVVPRRSDRLAGMSPMRHPKPEIQAKRVTLNKWKPPSHSPQLQMPDESIALKFHQTFAEPLSSSKRVAMRVLFPASAECAAVNESVLY
jgi:hypothetical protein